MQPKYPSTFKVHFKLQKESLEVELDNILLEITSAFGVSVKNQKRKITEIARDRCVFAVFEKGVDELSNEDRFNEKYNECDMLYRGFLGFCRLQAHKEQKLTFDEITYKLYRYIEFCGYKVFS